MNVREENQAINTIAALLPPGYVKLVPFSTTKDVSFEFNGVTVKMSKLYLNEAMNCYMFDLAWGATDKLFGLPIRCGVDIVQQYSTPLPNLYANNHSFPGTEISSWRDLNLFIIDVSVLERV
ncbi:TPA: hypothetical protein SIF59_004298 [Escherichia coli]|nr:hypothetical protein [Escherichia coli]